MIRYRNIYHMLAYAFSVLGEGRFRACDTEDFDNGAELCAAILEKGMSSLVRQGLGRDYRERTEHIAGVRGKIEVTGTMKQQALLRQQAVCTFDDFTVDSPMNRIIKSTITQLTRSDIRSEQKVSLRRLLFYFTGVHDVDLKTVDWRLYFDRSSRMYRMVIGVCKLVAEGLLQTQGDGSTHMRDFFDKKAMSSLYERFLREYFRKEHPGLNARASRINWALDDGYSQDLPTMRSDVTLSCGERTLIIDAKYYEHTMQSYYSKTTVRSANLYQLFTYVKNKEADLRRSGTTHEVSGLLLYAGTDEELQPNGTYLMSGNRISVRTLDLDKPFETIRASLDDIVVEHFTNEG